MESTSLRKLHLGCGANSPKGWINLDGSWNAWLSKYPLLRRLLKATGIFPARLFEVSWDPDIWIHDVRKLLPFDNNVIDVVYASHLLEHLYLEEAMKLLKECFRVLKHGGVLRMVVPDLKNIILEYLRGNHQDNKENPSGFQNKADRLNKRLLFHPPSPPSGTILYKVYSSLTDFHSHKWMYDAESLINYFEWAGFDEVQEMQFHQSRIADIAEIEIEERVLNGSGICVEGIKPQKPF